MSLLYVILLLNVLQQLIPLVAKMLARLFHSLRFKSENRRQDKQQAELAELQHAQQKISMMDEFAKYARLQRKIDKLTAEIGVTGKTKASSYLATKLVLDYGLQFAVGATMLYICLFYRHEPVMNIPIEWTSHFAYVLAFPNGELGTVTCIVWMLACRASIKHIFAFVSSHLIRP